MLSRIMVQNLSRKFFAISIYTFVLAISSFGFGVPSVSAATCYQVTAEKSLYIREKSNRNAKILTAVKHGQLLKKVGVPICGPWWCRVEFGQYKGFASKEFLEKADCP